MKEIFTSIICFLWAMFTVYSFLVTEKEMKSKGIGRIAFAIEYSALTLTLAYLLK